MIKSKEIILKMFRRQFRLFNFLVIPNYNIIITPTQFTGVILERKATIFYVIVAFVQVR